MHTNHHNHTPFRQRAPGTVLIVTIWVILVLTGLMLVFARSMRVSAFMAANAVAMQQAEMISNGAIQNIMGYIESDTQLPTLDSDEFYKAVQVGDGYFWMLRTNLEDDQQVDYGLVDESSKINLNTANLEMLQKLPGMTAELAASIIDWRDTDSDLTEGGAESAYYLLLSEPYTCKNAPLETIEEVLLIQGATTDILFGEDTNLNGVLDDNENDGDSSYPPDNRNGILESGLYDYVTVYSMEKNVDSAGNERININDPSGRGKLQALLEASFGQERALEIIAFIPTNPSFDNILAFYFWTQMTLEEFTQIADRLTTTDQPQTTGLVNINTAPKPVLLCLPSLEESDADALITRRSAPHTPLDSIAWVIDVLERDKALAIGEYITTRTYQHRVDIVSVSGNGRAFQRCLVVLDTQQTPTKIQYWKSLTHLGWPLERDILSALRRGESIP